MYKSLELISIVVACIGIVFAWLFYSVFQTLPKRFANAFSSFYKVLSNKWWIDELYGAIIVRPLYMFSTFLFKVVDRRIIDAMVNGIGIFVEANGEAVRRMHNGRIGAYATAMFFCAVLLIYFYLMIAS
jgi:NADH-quinone oxidoreductase subunit L